MLLQTRGLSKRFGGLTAVRDLDIDIEEGEIRGLIGPNGSGKTTFINVVTGYLPPTTGVVTFKGEQFSRKMRSFDIARRGIARTFQITSVFSNLTVWENVISSQHLYSRSALWQSLLVSKHYRSDEESLRNRASELLEFTGLQARAEALAGTISPGEQRRLEIAIALAVEPKLLLLDEPAAGLNAEEQGRLMVLIKELHRRGVSVLLVEHAMKVVVGLCQRITVLDFGSKIAEGSPQEIVNDEDVIKAYLGARRDAQS